MRFWGWRYLALQRGTRISAIVIEIENRVLIAGDIDFAVGLAFDGAQTIQDVAAVFITDAGEIEFVDEPLGPLFNCDNQTDVFADAGKVVNGVGVT